MLGWNHSSQIIAIVKQKLACFEKKREKLTEAACEESEINFRCLDKGKKQKFQDANETDDDNSNRQ